MILTAVKNVTTGLASLGSLALLSRSTKFSRSFSVMAQGDPNTASSIYDFTAKTIDGDEISLDKYRGKVAIVVNVASK